jgi:hypothetical protein
MYKRGIKIQLVLMLLLVSCKKEQGPSPEPGKESFVGTYSRLFQISANKPGQEQLTISKDKSPYSYTLTVLRNGEHQKYTLNFVTEDGYEKLWVKTSYTTPKFSEIYVTKKQAEEHYRVKFISCCSRFVVMDDNYRREP